MRKKRGGRGKGREGRRRGRGMEGKV